MIAKIIPLPFKRIMCIVLGPTCEKLLVKPNLKGNVSCLYATQFMEEANEKRKVPVVLGKEGSNG